MTPTETTEGAQVAPATKRCPSCSTSLPLDRFGRDTSRPPLYLQGRCRPCTNAKTSAGVSARRRVAKVAKDLAQIATEVAQLQSTETRMVPGSGPEGFDTVPTSILEVPHKGRWPARAPAPEELTAGFNWCDLIDGADSRRQYVAMGHKAQWSAEQNRSPSEQPGRPLGPGGLEALLAGPPSVGSFWENRQANARADASCFCDFCCRQERIDAKTATIKHCESVFV
ncbi:hypothetical protein WKW80_09225 [Variovorax humicola]|uniref:Uncharacterized protein n=1 Tax=Variovorax humicola TaxID=1769758 RepID=A0ABU8VWN3_9BURK